MLLATLNNVRWLPVGGLVASAGTAAVGVGDLSRVVRLGLVELAVAGAAAAVTIASFSGRYRRPASDAPPATPVAAQEAAP
jgi:hypothetical protein